jgi:predicted ester cyclase
MGPERADLAARYEQYLACCNERRFDQLTEFVDERVTGSGPVDGPAAYIEGVRAVATGFPDYRWDLQDLVIDDNTLAARLIGRGTHTGLFDGIAPTARRITIQELVIYRFANGRITHCWGDLYPVVRNAITTPAHT